MQTLKNVVVALLVALVIGLWLVPVHATTDCLNSAAGFRVQCASMSPLRSGSALDDDASHQINTYLDQLNVNGESYRTYDQMVVEVARHCDRARQNRALTTVLVAVLTAGLASAWRPRLA